MPEAVFVANLAMSLLALAIAATDAYPNRDHLTFLAAAVPYGVLLEQLVILRFERYQYPVADFLLTVADVPVVIGIGWAAIIYAGYRAADTWNLSPVAVPAFVGLFALHVDLAIDAVAIRVGFWTWTPPGVWFGVPLGNFLGWFLVASLFSGAWVALRGRVESPLVRTVPTLLLALLGLVLVLQAWEWWARSLVPRVLFLGGLLVLAAAVVARDRPTPTALPWQVSAVPLLFHGFYLVLLLGLGFAAETPALLVVSGAMLAVALALHRPDALRALAGGPRRN